MVPGARRMPDWPGSLPAHLPWTWTVRTQGCGCTAFRRLMMASAEEQAAWHDLSGADEPDWHFHLGFDALDSFAGFEGFDDSVDGPDGDVVFGRDETGARAWGNSGHPSPSVRGPGADVLRPAVESDDARIITVHGH